MLTITVLLKTIHDVKEFVRIVNNYAYDVDLVSSRYVVDAKSIMGIFSLDLANPLEAVIHSESAPDLLDDLRHFIV